MERIYEFEKNAYRYKVLLVNYLLIPIMAYCLYKALWVGANAALWAMGAAVCAYALINSFFRKSNPRVIRISDETITFSSFGEKSFEISKLVKFRLKVTTPNYQVLVRLEDSDRQSGSFWVTYSQFSDKLDLLAELDYLEKKIHPTSLRFRGRKGRGDARPGTLAEPDATAAASDATTTADNDTDASGPEQEES